MFGWSLPPGCSASDIERAMGGRDPTSLEEDVLEQLEKHQVPTEVCDKIMHLLDQYQMDASHALYDHEPGEGT
jgi:hypothetical protein